MEINNPGGYIMLRDLHGLLNASQQRVGFEPISEAKIAAAARTGKPVYFSPILVGTDEYLNISGPAAFHSFGDGDSEELVADVFCSLVGLIDGAVDSFGHYTTWSITVYSDDSVLLGEKEM